MADAPAFDWVCNEIERETSLERLEARGTLRLALKAAGLEARNVTPDQLKVVIEKILVGELTARGVSDAEPICARMNQAMSAVESSLSVGGTKAETPDVVFGRLGGGA
jgi:hypothetical protein